MNALIDKHHEIKREVHSKALGYCAINANLPFYSNGSMKAFNCTGMVQHMLTSVGVPMKKQPIYTPKGLGRELSIIADPEALKDRKQRDRIESNYERAIHSSYF